MDQGKLSVIVVEDNPDHAELIRTSLNANLEDPYTKIVETKEDCIREVRSKDYDIVVLDYRLGDADGLDVLSDLKNILPDLPVIIITGVGSENIAVKLMKMGAYDYIVKSDNFADILPATIIRATKSHRDLIDRKKAEEKAKKRDDQYKNLVQNINIGVFRCSDNEKCGISESNKALAKILGYSQGEDMHGKNIFDHFKDPEKRKSMFNKLVKTKTIKKEECEFIKKDGTSIWVSLGAKIEIDGKTGVDSIFGTLEDISAMKVSQLELENSLEKLKMMFKDMVSALTATSDIRDPFTAGHQKRVSQLTVAMAVEMGMSSADLEEIEMASLVHDIGKINIPIEILSNPRRLTELEYEIIKTHTQVGHDILKTIKPPWKIAQVIYQHHERMDGSGYPQGLQGEDILLNARVLAVADVVEAMASHRPYRPAMGIEKALTEINQNRGILYDPDVVDVCLRVFAKGFRFSD